MKACWGGAEGAHSAPKGSLLEHFDVAHSIQRQVSAACGRPLHNPGIAAAALRGVVPPGIAARAQRAARMRNMVCHEPFLDMIPPCDRGLAADVARALADASAAGSIACMPATGEVDNSSSQPRSTGSRDEDNTSASTASVQGGWHADTEQRRSGRMGPRTPMNRPAANSISTQRTSTTTRQTGAQTPRPKRASRAPQLDAQASGMASSATTSCDPTVGSTPAAIGQMGSAPSGASCSIPATSDPPTTAAIATGIDGKGLVVTTVCLVYTPASRPLKSILRALSRGYTATMGITSAANVDGEVAGCHIASTTDADTALLGQHTYNRHGPPLAQGEHKLPTDESSTTAAVATDHEDIVAPTTTGVKGVDLPTEEAFRPPKTLTRALSREPDVDARLQEWAASQSSELLKAYLGTLYAAGAPAAQLRPLHQELARRPIKDLVAEGVGLSRAARHDRRLQRPQQ